MFAPIGLCDSLEGHGRRADGRRYSLNRRTRRPLSHIVGDRPLGRTTIPSPENAQSRTTSPSLDASRGSMRTCVTAFELLEQRHSVTSSSFSRSAMH